MNRKPFGRERSPAFWAVWPSVKSHVLGMIGLPENYLETEAEFLKVAATIYGLAPLDPSDFEAAVVQIHSQVTAMSKAMRKRLRVANIAKIGDPTNSPSKAVRNALRKARGAVKAAGKRSARKQAAIDDYRKKHLVLVSKDGKALFDNVRQRPAAGEKDAFYGTWEWRTLRMKVLKRFGRRCQCCGANPGDIAVSGEPVRIVVDHIKPLANYWHLRLAPTNLQVLCDECNMGKGAWDETDHRSESQKLIAEQLRYDIGDPTPLPQELAS